MTARAHLEGDAATVLAGDGAVDNRLESLSDAGRNAALGVQAGPMGHHRNVGGHVVGVGLLGSVLLVPCLLQRN